MKNAEQPINPLTPDLDSSKHECIGLTKREYAAIEAMKGFMSMCAGNKEMIKANIERPDMLAEMSAKFADAILIQLENK